jgi:RNA polymerase sigma-70 factor (ECF subfamily)
MQEKEFNTKLQSAIESLPEGQKTAFLMNRIDQMTYAEIAEALDISVKAVEKRMHLALKTLRAEIEELKNR